MGDHGTHDIGPKKLPSSQDASIPPWQDITALCKHISCSSHTVDQWVAQGILPAPRRYGGKLMWKWSEVDDYLTHGGAEAADIDRIREATRRIVEQTSRKEAPAIDNQGTAARTPAELLNHKVVAADQAAQGHTLFVSDTELIQRLGVPEQLGRDLIREFDEKDATFPKKQQRWGDRRYWPAVKAWLDKTCGLETLGHRARKRNRSKSR